MRINKKHTKKGISLIVLIITIIVAIILVSAVVISTRSSINNARLTSFANDINELEDAVESYYLTNNVLPFPEDSSALLTTAQMLDISGSSNVQELADEISLNSDDAVDEFYYIDIAKLGVKRISNGLKKDGDNDVYVVAYPTMNVYYLKGISIDGVKYFSITSKISNIQEINVYNQEDNSSTSVTVYDGISVTRATGWTSIMPITLSTTIESNQALYISLLGTEKLVNTELGIYTKSFNFSDLFIVNGVLSGGASFADKLTEFSSKPQSERYMEIIKKDGSNKVIGKNRVDLSNYETDLPIITDKIYNNYTNVNVVGFKATDATSKIKEVRYDYLTKIGEDGIEKNYYEGITGFDILYLKKKGKTAKVGESGNVNIELPKNVRQIKVALIDNAGNWIIPEAITVEKMMYVGTVIDSATPQSLKLTANVYSSDGLSSLKFSIGTDASNYSNEQTFTYNTTDVRTSQQVEYTGINYTKVYVKVDATDNNSVVANRKSINKITTVQINGGTQNNPEQPEDPTPTVEYDINAPEILPGMTPIKWDSSKALATTTVTDPAWYDYNSKIWANVQTADGSMWVWIPRFEYRITTPNNSTTQVVAVNFLKGNNSEHTQDYIVHPAFTFGNTELKGIWVAKFEASGTTSAVDIKPGVNTIRNITIDSAFIACRNMESNSKYGWGTIGIGLDSHLIKNIEWGAVAYLSDSQYGLNGSTIYINPYHGTDTYRTGFSGTSANSDYGTTSSFSYAYNNVTYGGKSSTTGNVYGVYDMSGCAHDMVAAYLNNGNTALTTNGYSLYTADAKYKDIYSVVTTDSSINNYNANSDKKGDAMHETSSSVSSNSSSGNFATSWFSDWSIYPQGSAPFIDRGGYANGGVNSGIFGFATETGEGYENRGFRPVIVVSNGI